MPKLAQLSGKQIIKALEKEGYYVVRQKGSHVRLVCSDKTKKTITVPDHKRIGIGLLRKILRDAQLTVEEFKKLL